MSELKDVSGGEWSHGEVVCLNESLFRVDLNAGSIQNFTTVYGCTPEEALANAKLMAAAKDMAERLRKLCEAINYKHALIAANATVDKIAYADDQLWRCVDDSTDTLKKAGAA